METRTFFSDETGYFRTPREPDPGDTVRIRVRTGRFQARSVLLCLPDRYVTMTWEFDRQNFDYYYADVEVGNEPFSYFFSIVADGDAVFVGRNGVTHDQKEMIPFYLCPGFHTPDWAKGCLYYQIFPDRFFNGDPLDDVSDGAFVYGGRPVVHSAWGAPVLSDTYRQFYGGDLQGIILKLPYLKKLGVEAIYINPVFASPSSHKYDCCDYEHVDTGLGIAGDQDASDECLAELIREAHSCGIRVVLDGVFNHCSSAHRWFQKNRRDKDESKNIGAYGKPDSIFHDRFTFFDDACRKYEAWWGVPTLPKLNYEGDPSLSEEIYRIAQKWITPPYRADGWRLDVAADLGHSEEYNHIFWAGFRKAVRSVCEDTLIMAEHYDDPSPWLNGKEWDSIMNYNAFMDPVSYFFTGMEKHSDHHYPELKGDAVTFAEALRYHSALLPTSSLLCSLNQLDNHDHSRFLTRTNHQTGRVGSLGTLAAGEQTDISVLRQAAAFLYFWPGSPGLYYGDEAGLCGFTDPDNRRCFPWDGADQELLAYFVALGALRKRLSFIRDASTQIIYAEQGVFAFARFTDQHAAIVAVNAGSAEEEVTLPVWIAGFPGYEENRILLCVLSGDKKGFSFDLKPFIAHHGLVETRLSPGSVLVLTDGSLTSVAGGASIQ